MTTKKTNEQAETCPAQGLLKMLAGKWKPEIFRLAVGGPLRFSSLLRDIEGANKQSLSLALNELEESGLLNREVVREKPLHVAYHLTDKGKLLVPVFQQLEGLSS
ncbi:helix-turn-helix transcriptional regulator [Chitinophaga horti]|uniref:Helix-turn-helix transcriptional regulator n=1 Tax=Chitinophaga horti TaxID=2920382 RepID=A0ABY6J7P2_9BACT|nr:helix-turn-helix domain-containing protein [Chitinophaga horti]UYQ95691.1 helix-turn-helix transcriptional regulator [Chitinophaga horti]